LVRCDVCRRYARLKLAGLQDVDYRTKTFSCSACGSEALLSLIALMQRAHTSHTDIGPLRRLPH
jgi:hypothetical protein